MTAKSQKAHHRFVNIVQRKPNDKNKLDKKEQNFTWRKTDGSFGSPIIRKYDSTYTKEKIPIEQHIRKNQTLE